jgi:hypothetical protein
MMFLLVNMLQILPSVPLLGIEARSVVRLSWGAKLYCTDHVPELQTVYSEQMSTDHSADDFVPWRQISSSVMTSMVVSLDILPLFQEVLLNRYSAWNTSQLTTLLLALEASHWHARSFNENANLRRNLHRLGFMPFRDQPSRWPHLLEQEVQSLTLILEAFSNIECNVGYLQNILSGCHFKDSKNRLPARSNIWGTRANHDVDAAEH